MKANNDYVYEVEDLRHGINNEVHASRLKIYHDHSLDEEAVISHDLSSETGMVVHRLIRLVETEDGLYVQVRWKRLSESKDMMKLISNIYRGVSKRFKKLFL